MTTSSRPSSSTSSATTDPSCAGSSDVSWSNPPGAVSRISVPGDSSGSQVTGAGPTGRLGSWAKTQPPSPSETDTGGFGIDGGARDLALCADEVAAVIMVAAQEFDGEAWAFEAVQAINRLRRAPILRGHGVSSRFVPPGGFHDPENSSAKVVLKVASRVAASGASRASVYCILGSSRCRKPVSVIQRARARWLS